MKRFNVRVETNFLKGSAYNIDNYPDASVDETLRILGLEGLELAADDLEPITNYTFRHWVGPACFKQVHIFTA